MGSSDPRLLVAGVMCVLIAAGHATIGIVWVLPRLLPESLPRTPFGSPRMTEVMIRVTWHVVTIFVLALGGLLLSLSTLAASDPKTLLLRWFGAMWLAIVLMALFVVGRNASNLLRRPFSVLWMTSLTVLGIVLWMASTSSPTASMRTLAELGVVHLKSQHAFLVYNDGKPLSLSDDAQHLGDRVIFCESSQMFESPAHGEKFDILGRYYAGPARRGLDRYPVRVVGQDIYVDFERPLPGPERGEPPPADPTGRFCTS